MLTNWMSLGLLSQTKPKPTPLTGAFTVKLSGAARGYHTADSIGDGMFAIGGLVGATFLSTAARYDAATNTWGSPVAIPTPLQAHASAAIGSVVYFGGGSSSSGGSPRPNWYSWNIDTNAFTAITAAPTSRYRGHAVAVGNKIYVFGGKETTSNSSTRVEIYNTITDSWSSGAANKFFDFQAVTVIATDVYVIAGTLFWKYNTLDDTWTALPYTRGNYAGATLNAIGDLLYMYGGRLGSAAPSNQLWVFDTTTQIWSQVAAVSTGVYYHTTVVHNNSLIVYGGYINAAGTQTGQTIVIT